MRINAAMQQLFIGACCLANTGWPTVNRQTYCNVISREQCTGNGRHNCAQQQHYHQKASTPTPAHSFGFKFQFESERAVMLAMRERERRFRNGVHLSSTRASMISFYVLLQLIIVKCQPDDSCLMKGEREYLK